MSPITFAFVERWKRIVVPGRAHESELFAQKWFGEAVRFVSFGTWSPAACAATADSASAAATLPITMRGRDPTTSPILLPTSPDGRLHRGTGFVRRQLRRRDRREPGEQRHRAGVRAQAAVGELALAVPVRGDRAAVPHLEEEPVLAGVG